MSVKHFSELIVWQKAMDVAEAVYRATESFTQREVFGLAHQLRKSAVSVPSNVAEGQGRGTRKDFLHVLHVARGSLQELQTQLILAGRLGLIGDVSVQPLLANAAEVGKILNGLIGSLCKDA